MSETIKPLADYLLIEPLSEETTLPSGIVIPETAKEKPQEGKVVAVGPGKIEDGELIKPEVKKGDRVIYSKYGGNEVKANGKDLLIIKVDDIMAILE